MIYLKIQGGLGNQMFQYAAAYALAVEKKTKVGICLSRIKQIVPDESGYTNRNFELDTLFHLRNFTIVDPEKFEYITSSGKTFLQKIKKKLSDAGLYYEKNLRYDSSIHELSRESYIEGYFQSYKYFESIRNEIHEIFQFRRQPSPQTLKLLEQIKECTMVAVHVRRGDFISNEANLKTHGCCQPDYYINAANHFQTIPNCRFVVVSDDPKWVQENINFGNNTIYVNWNSGSDSWQDMLIISKCSHAIIANSSFSWWGAFLIKNPDKIVVAPKVWYADPEKQIQTADLIPENWVRL